MQRNSIVWLFPISAVFCTFSVNAAPGSTAETAGQVSTVQSLAQEPEVSQADQKALDELLKSADDMSLSTFGIPVDLHSAYWGENWSEILVITDRLLAEPPPRKWKPSEVVSLRAFALHRLSRTEDAMSAFETYFFRFPEEPKHEQAKIYRRWGDALIIQASGLKKTYTAINFAKADTIFSLANHAQPNNPETLISWSNLQLLQAAMATGPARGNLLNQAEKMLIEVVKNQPDMGNYEMSALWALRGNAVLAAKWLKSSRDNPFNLRPCDEIAQDRRFEQVRRNRTFRQTFKSIGCA